MRNKSVISSKSWGKQLGPLALLIALLVALAGPWAYTPDGAPPAEWCRDPFILLEGERCVRTMSGATIIRIMVGAFFSISAELLTGTARFADRGREYLGVFLLDLLLLPFLSGLTLIWGQDSRRRQVFRLATFGLGAAASLPLVLNQIGPGAGRLWGLWLYLGVTVSAAVLEVLVLRRKSRPTGERGLGGPAAG